MNLFIDFHIFCKLWMWCNSVLKVSQLTPNFRLIWTLSSPVLSLVGITQWAPCVKTRSHSLSSSICTVSNMWVRHIWSAASLTYIYSQIAKCRRSGCPPWATCTGRHKQTNPRHPLFPGAVGAQMLHSFPCAYVPAPLLSCLLSNRWSNKLAYS